MRFHVPQKMRLLPPADNMRHNAAHDMVSLDRIGSLMPGEFFTLGPNRSIIGSRCDLKGKFLTASSQHLQDVLQCYCLQTLIGSTISLYSLQGLSTSENLLLVLTTMTTLFRNKYIKVVKRNFYLLFDFYINKIQTV